MTLFSESKIVALLFLFIAVRNEAILNGLPVIFNLVGTTTFTPDSGGSMQSGYTINLGYTGSSWIAAQLVTISGNTDVLVVKIDDFYSSSTNGQVSGHLVTYGDYFRVAQGLITDSITQYDISSYAYSNSKTYSLPITRTLSSNNGQDWAASTQSYSILKVCFYTSSLSFDPTTFSKYYSVCQNYQINNLVSTFIGPFIKTITFNGYNTSVYGFIDGPYVNNKVYFYQQTPQFAYVQVPAVAIEIGTTAGNFGQDFQVSSPQQTESGDYYGADINHLNFDNNAFGYQHPALTLNHWNANPNNPIAAISFTALRLNFSRAVYTYDSYDKTMLSTFIYCLYIYTSGTISGSLSDKVCDLIELSPSYLQMTVPTSSYQSILVFGAIILIFIFL